ncbi:MAG TPA: hypothetical protein VF450_06940 [Noviherbaspirillum sp.]
MARQYSPKSFFRLAPNAMLKRYFDKRGVLAEHDLGAISETKIEPIYQAWLTLPDALRSDMEREFREIDALACEGGVKAILDEAEWHGENLAETLDGLEDLHQKSFWVFLERPKYWPAASAFYRADVISLNQWNECRTVSRSPARVDDPAIRNLEKVLSTHFFNTEGRGKNCTVEVYKRGKLDYFFAYPEDYVHASIEWDGPNFKRSARHPAFEIIFVYSQDEGKISLYMKGSRETKKQVRALFADAILGLELGEFVEDDRVFDLAPLHDSHTPFQFSPESGIQSVEVKKLRLAEMLGQPRVSVAKIILFFPRRIAELLAQQLPSSARLEFARQAALWIVQFMRDSIYQVPQFNVQSDGIGPTYAHQNVAPSYAVQELLGRPQGFFAQALAQAFPAWRLQAGRTAWSLIP